MGIDPHLFSQFDLIHEDGCAARPVNHDILFRMWSVSGRINYEICACIFTIGRPIMPRRQFSLGDRGGSAWRFRGWAGADHVVTCRRLADKCAIQDGLQSIARRLRQSRGIGANVSHRGQFRAGCRRDQGQADARSRFAAAMTLLSAGTPMFFMGKEIGAQKPCRYNDFLENRESILGEADGNGAGMISCYRDLIAVSVGEAAIRSRNIAIPLVHDENRVIAFHRWNNSEDFLVVGSLNDAPLMTATGCTANAWEMTFGRRSSIPMHANMAAGTSAIAAKRSEPRQERSMSSAGVRRAGLSQAIAGGGCGQAKPSGSLSSFLSAP